MTQNHHKDHYPKLSAEERERALSTLSAEQRKFLLDNVKRSQRTIYERTMQDEKITAIRAADDIPLTDDEKSVVDWKIADYIDFGEGNREGRCACGRKLRYQFTVEHQKTGRRIHYGIDHLSIFLNIKVNDILDVVNQLKWIDYELDQLLFKVENNRYDYEYYELLPDKSVVSKMIQKHIDFNVPLLDRHVTRLKKLREKQMQNLLEAQWNEKARQQQEINSRLAQLQKQYEEKERQRQFANKERENTRLLERATRIEKAKSQLPPDAPIEEIVYVLVLNGENSAVEISRALVNEFGMDKRMSLGTIERPRIYYDVLIALSKQVEIGNLIRDEASDVHDCFFYVNQSTESANGDVVENVLISEQQSLF